MKKLNFVGISIILLVFIVQNAYGAAHEWELDKAHSNIYFSIDHIYAKIQGHFNEFNAKVNFDPADLQSSRFTFEIKADSIDTGIDKRDKDLQSANFFDAGKYPLITFESKSIADVGGGVYLVAGNLTVKGKTYDLTLPLKFAGIKEHPAAPGKKVIGFNGKITLDRLSLNIGDEKFYKMGIIGKDVEVLVTVEALSDK